MKVEIKKFGTGYSCQGGDLGHRVDEPVSRMYVEVDVPISGGLKRLFAYKDFKLEHKSVTDNLTLGEIYSDLLGFRDERIDSQWRGIEPEEINGWTLRNTALVDDQGKVHID